MLGLSETDLVARGAIHTATEIAQQPAKWRELAALLRAQGPEVRARLAEALGRDDLVVVFTGAGTSAYAGAIAAAALSAGGRHRAAAVPTTDIVDAASNFLDPRRPTLLVSLARSGESPESVAACRTADAFVGTVWHLVITCDGGGRLARWAREGGWPCLTMPEGTNDAGFAMTSSFSCLTLAALSVFEDEAAARGWIGRAADMAEAALSDLGRVRALAEAGHERVVYLGGGAFKAAAAEAALKLLELTNGEVVATSETPLGFRHGPKAVVAPGRTLVVGFVGGARPASSYATDMLAELRRDGNAEVVAVGPPGAVEGAGGLAVADASPPLPDGWLAVVYLVFAQTLGLLTSLHRGHRPDNPNPAGQINRVVRGVTIHAD